MMKEFKNKMYLEGKSERTMEVYGNSVREFFKWFYDSYGNVEFKKLYRENVLEYKSYLKNIKKSVHSGNNLCPKSINSKLSALICFNELMEPDNIVVSKKDLMKIQTEMVSPATITKKEVEEFRQIVLQSEGCAARRNFAIVTILAYAGLRISECLNLRKSDICLKSGELKVASGKGEKARIVIVNSKIVSAVREYQKMDQIVSEWLFHNSRGERLNQTTINRVFKLCCPEEYHITPHTLRHFYAMNAVSSGIFTIPEIANQMGHSSIRTTMRYMNPSLEEIRTKVEML
ncbi:MAG: tyrosine-type recombinase/integrase [Lachnospiraceae bacterium]|nr:tyrosine-type recombinase/integrase [Lachnospiraceae bacterium]